MDLAAGVAELIARAAAEHPDLGMIHTPGFAAHLENLVSALPAERRAELHAGDLAIAYACAHRDPAALQVFEATCVPPLRAVLLGRVRDAAKVDDVLQDLRGRFLLDGPDAPAKLLAYGGRGPLGAWLRVAALRLTLSEDRRYWRERPIEDALLATQTTSDDPFRAERDALLRATLRETVAGLTSRQRGLMRLYYAEDIGVEDLGRMYRVHASTISRWLAQARIEIMARTRAALAKSAAASPSGVDSLLRHAASVDLDLESLLRTAD